MLSVAHTLIYSKILDSSLHPPVPQCPCISGESNSNAFYGPDRALSGRINEIILVTQFEFSEAGRILQKCTVGSLSQGAL